jgi:hypothetical protein
LTDAPNPDRIDAVLQFILVAAGQEDERRDRELGPIHLLKYGYLADMAYAQRHEGETFTGAPWRFHHFGPWAPQVLERIEPALAAIGATKRTFSSPRYDDFVRYAQTDERLLDKLQTRLPGEVLSAIRSSVHEFGSDTESLLRHVYQTLPMVHAAPGELLAFPSAAPTDLTLREQRRSAEAVGEPQLSWKVRRARAENVSHRRKIILERLERRAVALATAEQPTPRYDSVYFEGLAWLDNLAGAGIKPLEGEMAFADDIWKSRTRADPDVP